jgi:hypothetical protein
MTPYSPWSVDKQTKNTRKTINPKKLELRKWNPESKYLKSELDEAFDFNSHETEVFGSRTERYAKYKFLNSNKSTSDEGLSSGSVRTHKILLQRENIDIYRMMKMSSKVLSFLINEKLIQPTAKRVSSLWSAGLTGSILSYLLN